MQGCLHKIYPKGLKKKTIAHFPLRLGYNNSCLLSLFLSNYIALCICSFLLDVFV